ncbi:hypothetical protein [Nocardioides abyssi]|uniref:Uncharacterized protein n=1 Tax=Nocardioides abyssi TaxID=3058370 RepID=A0ABT8EWX6_9ACTN|nr:hypothetical protein [Nocardioides abyssi]MDN4162687.1 hypothetical protein [Nocardioides abyssi]
MAAGLTGRDVALAVVPGALGLLDPSTLSPRALTAYRLGLTAASTAAAVDGLRDADLDAPPAVGWLSAAVVGGLTWRTMPRWERTDVALHRWLTAHGVPRSRVVVAVASTAVTLALAASSRRRAEDEASDVSAPGPGTPGSGPESGTPGSPPPRG